MVWIEGTVVKLCATRYGLSLLELIVTITILGILAAGVVPLIRNTAIRTNAMELHRNLRIISIAIDDYKKTYDKMATQVSAVKAGQFVYLEMYCEALGRIKLAEMIPHLNEVPAKKM